MPLALKIATAYRRRIPTWVDPEELVSVASLGLVAAADKFDPNYRPPQGDPNYDPWLAFGAFAKIKINGAIQDWMRTQDHVPRRQRQLFKSMETLGTVADPELTAERLGVDIRRVRAVVTAVKNTPVSLEADTGFQPQGWSTDPVSSANTESSMAVSAVQDAVVTVYASMTPEEKSVLALRYYMGYDFPRIAQEMESTLSRVKVICQEAVAQIHSVMVREVS